MKTVAPCALVMCLLASACGVPGNDEVRRDFLSGHATYAVVSVGVGEGDGAAAYFHVKYRKPSEDTVYEDVWQYMDEGKGSWKPTHKETLASPSVQPERLRR